MTDFDVEERLTTGARLALVADALLSRALETCPHLARKPARICPWHESPQALCELRGRACGPDGRRGAVLGGLRCAAHRASARRGLRRCVPARGPP